MERHNANWLSAEFSRSYSVCARYLECNLLPEDYILQFRYLPTWVDPAFLNDPAALLDELDGRQGPIVFADMPRLIGSSATDYKFYPIRLVRIVEPYFVGPVLYVPMVLGDFEDYGRWTRDELKLGMLKL